MVIAVGHEPNPTQRLRTKQGKRIRELRGYRRLTLAALAARMCEQEGVTITPAAISEWERGVSTPRQHHQIALAKALDTTWSSLFSLEAEVAW